MGIVVVAGCGGGEGGGGRALCEGAIGSTGQCWSRQLYPERFLLVSIDSHRQVIDSRYTSDYPYLVL